MSFSQEIGGTFDQGELNFIWPMSPNLWGTFFTGEVEATAWDLDHGPDSMEQPG